MRKMAIGTMLAALIVIVIGVVLVLCIEKIPSNVKFNYHFREQCYYKKYH